MIYCKKVKSGCNYSNGIKVIGIIYCSRNFIIFVYFREN